MWSIGHTQDKVIRGLGDQIIVNNNNEIILHPHDMLSIEFLNNIINKHNDEVTKEYEKGIRDGIGLVKELRVKKD